MKSIVIVALLSGKPEMLDSVEKCVKVTQVLVCECVCVCARMCALAGCIHYAKFQCICFTLYHYFRRVMVM